MRHVRRDILGVGAALLSAACLVLPRTIAAQGVRGVVRSQTTDVPAVGAVVLLLDTAGVTRASAVSDERGEFQLTAPVPGRYLLDTRRLGFVGSVTAPFTLSRDTTVAIALTDVPRTLPALARRADRACRVRPDSTLLLGALWEDAKTALLAAAITRARGQYRFDLVDYTRVLDPDTRALRAIAFSDSAVYDARPWESVPPDRLARDGYVLDSRAGVTFAVPDLAALLSSDFADQHCFRVDPNTVLSDSLVAIEFEPVRSIDHAEIRGRIWIDRRTHELRSIDFEYVNIEVPDDDTRPAGRVDFARLPTGAWVIADWSVALPLLRAARGETDARAYPTGRRRFVTLLTSRDEWVTTAVRVQGGTLRTVWRDSVRIWSRPLRTLRLRVTSAGDTADPASSAPRDVVAFLDGTARMARPDSAGIVTFADLLPGSYLVEIGSRDLDVLGWRRPRIEVDVPATEDDAAIPIADQVQPLPTVRLDPAVAAARAACGDDAKLLSPATGVIVGTVTHHGAAAAGRDVVLRWARGNPGAVGGDSAARDMVSRDTASRGMVSRTARTWSGDGRFLVCGVPRDRPIRISIAGGDSAIVTRFDRGELVDLVALQARP